MNLDSETETVNLDNDLQVLELCDDDKEFKGFNLIEYGGKQTLLSPDKCKEKNRISIDLTGKRLIGFRVVIS